MAPPLLLWTIGYPSRTRLDKALKKAYNLYTIKNLIRRQAEEHEKTLHVFRANFFSAKGGSAFGGDPIRISGNTKTLVFFTCLSVVAFGGDGALTGF